MWGKYLGICVTIPRKITSTVAEKRLWQNTRIELHIESLETRKNLLSEILGQSPNRTPTNQLWVDNQSSSSVDNLFFSIFFN